MNIALINSPVRLNDVPRNIPTGLAIIAKKLLNNNHDVTWIDLNAQRKLVDDIDAILDKITSSQIVGLSGLVTTYGYQKDLINKIKTKYPNKYIVTGGSLASSIPDLLFEKTKIDALCLGEGDIIFSELIDKIEKGIDYTSMDGMWFREGGHIIKNKQAALIKDLDTLPFPAYELVDMDIYLKNYIWENDKKRSVNIITSRGCPFNCTYCYHIFGRNKIRFRSPGNIQKEVLYLKEKYGVDYVAMVDDNATINKKRLLELCDRMKETGIQWGCHGRVDTASPEMFNKLKDSGCTHLGFGIESGSKKILKNINKGTTKEIASNAMKWQHEAEFKGNSYIFGSPGENLLTMLETAIFCGKNKAIVGQMFIMTAYPGTQIFYQAMSDGKIKNLEEYVYKLGDAHKMLINFSSFPDWFFNYAYIIQIILICFFNILFHPVNFFKKFFGKRINKIIKSL